MSEGVMGDAVVIVFETKKELFNMLRDVINVIRYLGEKRKKRILCVLTVKS